MLAALPFSHHFPILAVLKDKEASSLQVVNRAITQVIPQEQIIAINFNIKSQSQGDICYLSIMLSINSEEELAALYDTLSHCELITQLF